MRTTSDHFRTAKAELREALDGLSLTELQRLDLSKRIAKFSAHAVREDRVHRMPHSSLEKLCDMVGNGRPA